MHALTLLLTCLSLGVDPDFVSLSIPLEFRYTGGGYRDELFRYRLFLPNMADQKKNWPLIVWLHGNCESQRDNIAHLRWLDQFVFRPPWHKGRYPFFLLAVQCPRDNFDWTRRASDIQDDMANVAAAIVEQTLGDYPIDPDRVYLSGVSSGGSGCWEFALRHPELFAAVAPMGSDGGNNTRVDQLKDMPVWAFHCNRDTDTPVALVRATVRVLSEAGGKACLTEIDSAKHDCWTAAFNDYHLLDWLLSQRRGQPSPPPGSVPFTTRLADFAKTWQWWQAVAQVAIPLAICSAIWNLMKTSVRARSRANQTVADDSNTERASD
jgi:predicted esterase